MSDKFLKLRDNILNYKYSDSKYKISNSVYKTVSLNKLSDFFEFDYNIEKKNPLSIKPKQIDNQKQDLEQMFERIRNFSDGSPSCNVRIFLKINHYLLIFETIFEIYRLIKYYQSIYSPPPKKKLGKKKNIRTANDNIRFESRGGSQNKFSNFMEQNRKNYIAGLLTSYSQLDVGDLEGQYSSLNELYQDAQANGFSKEQIQEERNKNLKTYVIKGEEYFSEFVGSPDIFNFTNEEIKKMKEEIEQEEKEKTKIFRFANDEGKPLQKVKIIENISDNLKNSDGNLNYLLDNVINKINTKNTDMIEFNKFLNTELEISDKYSINIGFNNILSFTSGTKYDINNISKCFSKSYVELTPTNIFEKYKLSCDSYKGCIPHLEQDDDNFKSIGLDMYFKEIYNFNYLSKKPEPPLCDDVIRYIEDNIDKLTNIYNLLMKQLQKEFIKATKYFTKKKLGEEDKVLKHEDLKNLVNKNVIRMQITSFNDINNKLKEVFTKSLKSKDLKFINNRIITSIQNNYNQ